MTNWQETVSQDYNMCFACGQENPIGLKLKFEWDGKTAKTEFIPHELYQGWSGVVQGGIICTMLDEGASYAVLFEGMNPITARMEIRFRRPAVIGEPLIITGTVTNRDGKWFEARAEITRKNDGTLIAEGKSSILGLKKNNKDNGKKQG